MPTAIGNIIDMVYPLARGCQHLLKADSLELEEADDRYYDIVVTRCVRCHMPLNERYAEPGEKERLQSE